MDAFSEEEMAVIDRVIDDFRSTSGKQMVDDAHEFPGWIHAWRGGEGARSPIPYESVFWERRDELTPAQQQHAAELAVDRDAPSSAPITNRRTTVGTNSTITRVCATSRVRAGQAERAAS
jgi:hypothetical protein